jgi:hypothetical protein
LLTHLYVELELMEANIEKTYLQQFFAILIHK